jgi:hypothetical protein
MHRRRRDQRTRESMQLRRTGVVIVIVRARRANRVRVPVDDDQQSIPNYEQCTACQPAGLFRQFRQQPEQRHAQQHARTQRNHQARSLAQPCEPHSQGRAGHAHSRGQ